ncbi:DUF3349 domain-containing protein [Nocardia sp. NBC_00565]|uniref:DUF3349 domain-containing protein n=1 Tax=Nocardia sp. NBC_00565 TaxID=2975993 RepID=UPI002E81DF2B|nr:DUF3349 domain-containing protein [Nocardia sp. NBC_00565]WUC04866.1 DUF3349 domain-containing protein [Nocardia sp. NBC_00565]
MTSNASFLESVLNWLRAGYPQGVPQEDYVALFAVLHRRLTEPEVNQIVEQLVVDNTDGTIERSQVEAAISKLAHEKPGEDDVNRVAARLAAVGWPLAHPSDA